jgi:hypothetical protein
MSNALQTPQQPATEIRVGQGIVCDTKQQIERVASLVGRAGDTGDVIKVVNEEAGNPVACAVIQAAFVQGSEVDQIRSEKGMLNVVEITILAVPMEGKWQMVAPVKQFAAFPLEGVEV